MLGLDITRRMVDFDAMVQPGVGLGTDEDFPGRRRQRNNGRRY